MTFRITQSHNEYRLAGSLARLEVGAGPATIELVEGTPAGSLDSGSGTGTVCATITLHKPCGSVVSGELVLVVDFDANVVADGTPNYAVWRDGNGAVVMDCDVGSTLSTAGVRISPTTLVAGSTVHVLSSVLR